MLFAEFIKHCQVWHLGRFWHIHMLYRGCDLDEHMKQVSRKTKLPIRWSSVSGRVSWTTGGEFSSPYEPALFKTMEDGRSVVSTEWNGFDPTSGVISLEMNPRTGDYKTRWKDDGKADHPSRITTNTGSMYQIGNEPGVVPDGIFEPNHVVSHYLNRITSWVDADGIFLPRQYGKQNEFRRCSQIGESHVFERGYIQDDKTPVMVRYCRSQTHVWHDDKQKSSSLITGDPSHVYLSRIDGPALVRLDGVTTRIIGDTTIVHLSDKPHYHEWVIGGKKLDPAKMADVIKRNGLIVRDGPLHEHPAFPRQDDLLIWAASW